MRFSLIRWTPSEQSGKYREAHLKRARSHKRQVRIQRTLKISLQVMRRFEPD
jgi:hypothetical protein